MVALSKDGKLYSWGSNEFSTIAGCSEHVVLSPKLLELPSLIKKVAIGSHHTVVITAENKVYSWGDNSEGQLGIGSSDRMSVNTPTAAGEGKMG